MKKILKDGKDQSISDATLAKQKLSLNFYDFIFILAFNPQAVFYHFLRVPFKIPVKNKLQTVAFTYIEGLKNLWWRRSLRCSYYSLGTYLGDTFSTLPPQKLLSKGMHSQSPTSLTIAVCLEGQHLYSFLFGMEQCRAALLNCIPASLLSSYTNNVHCTTQYTLYISLYGI